MQQQKEKVEIIQDNLKVLFARKDIVSKISNLSNVNIVNVLFLCAGR